MFLQILISVQTFVFPIDCYARVNIPVLKTAIQAQAPGADIEQQDCINWSDGTQTQRTITVTGVPDGITKQQVRQFLVNHNPVETDQEELVRKTLEARDAKLRQMPVIQEILADIAGLKGGTP